MRRWIMAMAVLGTASMGLAQDGRVGADQSKPADGAQGTITIVVDAQVDGAPGQPIPAQPAGTATWTATARPQVLAYRTMGKMEKGTYLGAQVQPATTPLRDQLKLARETGLVVVAIDAKSPAEEAGLKQSDVIVKLDDQILINPQQLDALVRAMKPGDTATLSVVRQGQALPIKAKLIEKDMAAASAAIQKNQMFFTAAAPVGTMPGTGQRVFVRNIEGKQTTEWSDEETTLKLERENAATKKLIVIDRKSGKEIFNGPAETAEQRKAIPADVLKKLEKAEQVDPANDAGPVHLWLNGNINGGGPMVMGGAMGPMAARGRVVSWSDNDHMLVLRIMGKTPTYLLALSKKDGKVLFDGPVMTDEQKQGLPTEIVEPFGAIAAHPEMAKEFGAAAVEKK